MKEPAKPKDGDLYLWAALIFFFIGVFIILGELLMWVTKLAAFIKYLVS